MAIIGIVAVDRNNAIGRGGRLPWHYSADLKFFKATTLGHACVMGRRTWNAIRRPLPERLNIVLTRTTQIPARESVVMLENPSAVLSLYRYLATDLFVIGGAETYRSFLPHIERWIVTEVPLTVEEPDTFMPPGYLSGFTARESRELEGGLNVTFFQREQAQN